jgi:DUF4097 and DUF4098 domain-containing protein YvlB
MEYVAHGPLAASVRLGSGELVVERAEPGTASAEVRPLDPDHEPSVRLAASAQISFDGDRLDVRVPEQGRIFRRGEVRVSLALPVSSSVALKAGAVDVDVAGGLTGMDAKIGSGAVRIDHVDGLAVKAGQVDVQVDRAGAVAVSTGQGTLRAQHVGDTMFKTVSGNVELGRTDGNVAVKGGSVDLTIHEAQSGSIALTTGSGDAHVCVVTGTTVELDLTSGSGDVRCDLPMESSAPPGGAALRLRLKTGSGDLRVAATAPV